MYEFILYLSVLANMNKRQRDHYYEILKERDGEYCFLCHRLKEEIGILEVHETRYTKPLDSGYMRLLCHGCNHKPELSKQNIISQREHTPEHKKNLEAEPYYENWLYGELMLNNWNIPLDDAVDNGAYNVGVSPETIKRYLRKLTAKDAPYIIYAGDFGQMHVWLKSKMPKEDPKY